MPCDSNCLSNLCVATWFYQYRIQLVPLKSETSNILQHAPLAPVTCTGQVTTGASRNAGLPCRHTSQFLGGHNYPSETPFEELCINYFPCCCDKMPSQEQCKENGIDFGSQLKGTVQPNKEGLAAGA